MRSARADDSIGSVRTPAPAPIQDTGDGGVKAGRIVCSVVALTVLVGCGATNTTPIPGRIAAGPGFSVKLPKGWRSFDPATRAKLARETAQEGRAKGIVSGGVLPAGHWIDPSSTGKDSLVVEVELATTDTSDATLAQRENAFLRQGGFTGVRRLAGPATVDGVAVVDRVAYRLNGVDLRGISARRGTYLYSISVGAKTAQAGYVDNLLATVLKVWRWTTTAAPALARLEHYSGHGYTVTLPAGWTGHGSSDARLAGINDADSLWSGYVGGSGTSFAAVFVRPAGGATLDRLAAAELRNGGRRAGDEKLDGARAAVLDSSSHGTHLHEWIVLHGGRAYAISVRTTEARRARDVAAMRRALDSWRFL
jgi:hypothetical protein